MVLGDAKLFGDGRLPETAEVMQVNDLSRDWILVREFVECINQWLKILGRPADGLLVEVDSFAVPTVFGTLFPASVVNQHALHGDGGGCKEVAWAIPLLLATGPELKDKFPPSDDE